MESVNGSVPLFQQLDEYPWDQDEEFQGGLQAILGSVQDPDQVEHLTLRAKCYYFARKTGDPVDFDSYRQWKGQHASTEGTVSAGTEPSEQVIAEGESGGGMANAPKPASFAEICEMIADGKPIPGIKDIPDTILEGQASDSQTSTRKKPWEREQSTQQPSWMA